MDNITISTKNVDNLRDFLQLHGFEVNHMQDSVYKVVREDELPVYIHVGKESIYFELDLGNVESFASLEFYRSLLEMNPQIQPVSFAINQTNPDDPRLVLVESRVTVDLCSDEVLSIFDALELASDKAESMLQPYLKDII